MAKISTQYIFKVQVDSITTTSIYFMCLTEHKSDDFFTWVIYTADR